eukprot:bmy_05139T0
MELLTQGHPGENHDYNNLLSVLLLSFSQVLNGYFLGRNAGFSESFGSEAFGLWFQNNHLPEETVIQMIQVTQGLNGKPAKLASSYGQQHFTSKLLPKGGKKSRAALKKKLPLLVLGVKIEAAACALLGPDSGPASRARAAAAIRRDPRELPAGVAQGTVAGRATGPQGRGRGAAGGRGAGSERETKPRKEREMLIRSWANQLPAPGPWSPGRKRSFRHPE